MDRRAALARLFVFHAAATGAAGAVLLVAPGLIPRAVGVALEPRAYLLAYLLAGAELGFAALSLAATRLRDPAALRAIVWACVAFHAASALGELRALAGGADGRVWLNVAVRALVAALFLHLAPRAPDAGASSGPRGRPT